jgi:hypothetical protein
MLSNPCCSEWDNRSQSKRSLMAVALPATLAILVASVALGGACLYSQKQLQSLPRARQSPSDWLEESGAKNQVSGVTAVREAATRAATTTCNFSIQDQVPPASSSRKHGGLQQSHTLVLIVMHCIRGACGFCRPSRTGWTCTWSAGRAQMAL